MTKTILSKVLPLMESKLEFNVKETLDLISRNKPIYWSWGVHQLSNIRDKGLMFKVQGHHHKGWVLITLDYTDTYDVFLLSPHGNLQKEFNMIYFDELMELIDEKVERIKEYVH